MVYEIEVFEDALFTLGVASASGIAEGTDVTAWPVPLDLRENTRYHWRVRAADGNRASQWAYGSFFVNLENEAPGAFALSWPADGFEVDTLTPALAVTNSRDPDEDPLTYAFEVYEDEALALLAASVSGMVEGAGGPGGGGATSWTVDAPLGDGATYWWKAVATDEHGVSTESAVGSFVVNLANHAPTVPLLAAPGAGSEVSETALALVVANAADPDADPDGDPLTYTFELDTVPTFDSPEKQAMAGILEGTGWEPGQTSWEVPGALRDDTRYYWRAKASDEAAESPWTAVATFFVSTANDPPSAPTLRNPSDGGEVGSTAPLLVLKEALDPEEESLTYDYELYADAGLTTRVAAAEGQGLAWAPPQPLDDDRYYHWRARAVDAHGLAGEWMAAARFVVNEAAFLDPPAVALTLPGAGGLRTNQAAVALAWTASNPSGTALVSLYFDEEGAGYAGTLLAAGLAPEAGAYAWDVTELPEGTYYVYVAIEDSYGAAKAYAPGSVILDRTPPATSASPPGGLYAAAQLVALIADDEEAVIRYTTGGLPPDASSPVYTGPIAVESSTVLSFFAVDPAGNPGEVRAETYVIDTEPPAVAIASPLPGLTSDPAPVLAYSASDGTVRVLVDGIAVAKVSGDRLDPLADGPHTVRVEATDAAGNVGFAEVSFAVETAAPTELLVPVRTSRGSGLPGVRVYAFTAAGAYTGKSATADASGVARFDPKLFSAGSYKLRADYLGYPFWSAVFTLPGTGVVPVEIAEETAAVQVTQGGAPRAGVKVYLFTGAGAYLGRFAITDADGMVRFDLPAGKDYKLRADLLGGQYWSDVLAVGAGAANAFAVVTGGGVLTTTVDSGDGTPVAGANVYLFSAGGSYLGLSRTTDTAGRVSFDVPTAGYKLRCDLLGYQFWSDLVTVTTDTAIPFPIPHRDVTARVVADYAGSREAKPYVRVYLFTEAGSYLGRYQDTNEAGEVTFRLPERAYKLRADVLAFQYWSEPFSWTDPTLVIPEGTAEVRVTQAEQPLAGVKVYAFTAAGAYLSLHGVTLADGTASFRLPAQTYRFRADHQGSQYWSADTALLPDQVNSVPVLTGGGAFTLRVTDLAGTPLVGLPCYLFGAAGSYLGESRTTTSAGEAGFDLADGTYRFRVDHKGYSFWTDPAAVTAAGPFDQGLVIDQRATTAAVQRDYGGALVPAQAIPVYLFTEAGAYLGERRTTNAAGQAVFELPDRSYQVRADYLSGQFWSAPFTAADPVITIAEGQAEVAVTQAGSPVAGVKVYAFNAGGTYLVLNETTDAEGKVYFWLPEGTYGFRADVQGSQYFANATLVPHQVNSVQLSTGGGPFQLVLDDASGPLAGVRVYAFTASGAYLGLYGTTDAAGTVAFTLSDGSYRFRADYLGYPFWSGPHDVPHQSSALFPIPHQEVTVTVEGQDPAPFPLAGIRTYLFTEGGAYLNRHADTDAAGQVRLRLPEQSYQVRADYLGYSFWSEPFTGVDPTVIVEHGTAAVRVTRGGAELAGARVYLFTAAGAYQGRFETTDAAGTATFRLPDRGYKLRVDIDGTQTWSEVVEILGGVTNPVAVDVAAP
ncbi:MAG: chitobiase/beta-hexosaminidase C-terminal domain-containing protein [Thermodesulfobacteriota bacterium]